MLLTLWLLIHGMPGDTLRIRPAATPFTLDGRADSAEYGAPDLRVRTGQGDALVWIRRRDSVVVIAAQIPDSTYYWGDDFVLSLDPTGDASPSVADDDAQWYFRRNLDSSVVSRGRQGRWVPPQGDPDWRLRSLRAGEGWSVWSTSEAKGWSLELRLDAEWLSGHAGRLAGLAVRIYDDAPHGWYVWPTPPDGVQPRAVEHTPRLWVKLSS